MTHNFKIFILLSTFIFLTLFFTSCVKNSENKSFHSQWPDRIHRTWIGPDYWTNPLHDWEIEQGTLKCLVNDYNRSIVLLTREIVGIPEQLMMSVQLGIINAGVLQEKGWAGFRLGIKGQFDDYRDSAVHGRGLNAGLTTTGKLFIGEWNKTKFEEIKLKSRNALSDGRAQLRLIIKSIDQNYTVQLSLWSAGQKIDSVQKRGFEANELNGLIALVVDFPRPAVGEQFESFLKINRINKNLPSFWFKNWNAEGTNLNYFPERKFGPILFAQHSLSKGIMKMTVQMPPIAESDSQYVHLEIKDNKGTWTHLTKELIHPLARTATFKVSDWNVKRDIPYRLSYTFSDDNDPIKVQYFAGVVRKDPVNKSELVIAGFTGNNDLGFPNNELVKHLQAHKPDLLFFSGDQIYESVGGYGYITNPLDKACLDYLRKWYMFGWEYRDLLRFIPSVSIPDDHDVYHGNIWGEGGKAASEEGDRKDRQDSGGYMMPPEWVNMVERTQTSHLPDPYDPAPIKQGIGVYYTDMKYGGVSFAIIEDRKFKSAPKRFFPESAKVKNGWAENPEFRDPQQFNVSGAKLLGDRQMEFLNDWVQDWEDNIWMKVLLSQTIFSTVATLPDSALSDVVVPTLRISEKGFYPKNDRPTQDMDSNGWPKMERDRVLRIIRKGFAIHLAGDQHLGSTIQYGIDSWEDASFALCVPSVANYFPRRWFPREGSIDWQAGAPKNLGKFYDGFGNRMTVRAVANPYFTGMKPSFLYDRAPGYGIVKLNKVTREIEMANWSRQVDPDKPNAMPYESWPIRFNQLENYGRKAVAWLPEMNFMNVENPVIKIIEESTNELIYALRINGSAFSPKVFSNGLHAIQIVHHGKTKVIKGLQPNEIKDQTKLDIEL